MMEQNQSQKRILLVEDDDLFRQTMKTSLEKEGFIVEGAENGKIGMELAGLNHYDLILADINMPVCGGVELTRYVKGYKPKLPIILMTGLEELIETFDANELGTDAFIAKPFQKNELMEIILNLLGIEKKKEIQSDEQFCKVLIDDFLSGKKIQYDLYIRLSEKKYVKIANSGDEIPIERIRSYKTKNIIHLYMNKDDFRKYIGMQVALLPAVKMNTKIPKQKKVAFLKHSNEMILAAIEDAGLDKESFNHAYESMRLTISLVSDYQDAMKMLFMLNDHTDHVYAHSIGVSIYSVLISKELRWHSPATAFKLSMGGLFHDIGKKEIDRNIINKARIDMKQDEVQFYESHVTRSVDLITQLPGLPVDIVYIAAQCHENQQGTGYPNGMRKTAIHPLAKVVHVADEFCKLALKNPNSPEGMTSVDAIKKLGFQIENIDKPSYYALMRCFGVETPEDSTLAADQVVYDPK